MRNKTIKAYKVEKFRYLSNNTKNKWYVINDNEEFKDNSDGVQFITFDNFDNIFMEGFTPIKDFDKPFIKNIISSNNLNTMNKSKPFFISTKSIDLIGGLENVLELDTTNCNEIQLEINAGMEKEGLEKIVSKLKASTKSRIYLLLYSNSFSGNKNYDTIKNILENLKITELKLFYGDVFFRPLSPIPESLCDLMMNVEGLESLEYTASSYYYNDDNERTVEARNLKFRNKLKIQDLLLNWIEKRKNDSAWEEFYDYMVIT